MTMLVVKPVPVLQPAEHLRHDARHGRANQCTGGGDLGYSSGEEVNVLHVPDVTKKLAACVINIVITFASTLYRNKRTLQPEFTFLEGN